MVREFEMSREKKSMYYITTSRALYSLPNLEVFLGANVKRYCKAVSASRAAAMLAWGRKASSLKADRKAAELGIPVLRLEDGFIRSVSSRSDSPLSLVRDDVGIYYDASKPSRLDLLLDRDLDDIEVSRASNIIKLWRDARISKYNNGRESDFSYLKPFVLVIDQTYGDASVTFGGANSHSFQRMLDCALERFPDHQVVIKTHPDVIHGRKSGYLTNPRLGESPRIKLISEPVHPPSLIEKADAVFCVTSQIGFEALIWGKEVHVFGMPFYAGRGLTNDYTAPPSFRKPISLFSLVYRSLVDYPRYVDPETADRCTAERAISWLGFQREQIERFPGTLYIEHIPRWKRSSFNAFFAGSSLVEKGKKEAPSGVKRVVWGRSAADDGTICVEDGFIRSVGLGADLVQPQSWIIDSSGMYYDSSRPSRLELMLQFGVFFPQTLKRADKLIDTIKSKGITKYNTGLRTWQAPLGCSNVVLVPGQVESDASIRYGSPVVKRNLDLLKAVRRNCPGAYILYKPHPDVVAGLRKNGNDYHELEKFCDELVFDQDMSYLLERVDEVHTITSLTGFEALLRGVKVTCYGQPFYGGWGLTNDVHPCSRRTRRRSLEELVAAALIFYPTYISVATRRFTTVETVIREIEMRRLSKRAEVSILKLVSRYLRRFWKF